jgi:hypothetical protein
MPPRLGRRALAAAAAVLLAAPCAALAADRPTAGQLDTTQQIALAAMRKLALLQASLDGEPPPDPVNAGKGGIVRVTVSQMRINQRIAQAALRRAAAVRARSAGRPAPAVTPGRGDAIRLTTRQATITRKIAVAAMRRANALAKRIPYWHPRAELELTEILEVRTADLDPAGHAAIGMLLGKAPAAAVRVGPRGRWRVGRLAGPSGDRTVRSGPVVRVNARGAALAVWFTGAGQVVAARREPGGRWTAGAPVGLTGLSAVALGDDGTARAIGEGGKVRTQPDSAAAWSAPFADALVPGVIDLDRAGHAIAAWAVDDDAPPATRSSQIFSATLGPSGWSAPELVARTKPGTVAGQPAAALGKRGDAAVAWVLRQQASLGGGLQEAARPAGGPWGAPVDVRPRGLPPSDPSVAVGDAGTTVVSWREPGLTNVRAASRAAGATAFGPPATLFQAVPDDSVLHSHATVHATGDAPTVLLQLDRHGAQVEWEARRPGEPFIELPYWEGGSFQAAAVAAGGGILIAAKDDDSGALRIESRSTD